MVNNDFRIMGIATTDFTEITSSTFVQYVVIVEVEKMGSRVGNHFKIPVVFYSTNKAVDFKAELKGKNVCIVGYCDSFNKDNYLQIKLVGQNVYLLDTNSIKDIQDNDYQTITLPNYN